MTSNNDTFSLKFYALLAVVLGALLGLTEASLGFIRQIGLPRSPALAGAGFLVMAAGLAVYKKAGIIPGIALAAVFSRWLAVPLLGLPAFCQANAHLALLLNGAALFAGVSLARKGLGKGPGRQGVMAGLAAFASGAAFFALGRFWAPCAHLLSFRFASGAAAYLLTRAAPAALLAGLLFPLGYALGRRLERGLLPLWLARKPLLAPLAGTVAAAFWGLTVWLTAAAR